MLEAQHVPGTLNVRADQQSQVLLDRNNWQLYPVVFNLLNQTWGPLDLDLFAFHLSAQLPRFVRWRPDAGAEAFDVFFQEWSKARGYAFRPFALVGRCLRQVLAQEGISSSPDSPCLANKAVVSTTSIPVCGQPIVKLPVFQAFFICTARFTHSAIFS